ncbi:PaaI family thioesterase [Sphingomonas sp.]|uniref:PaaI family thioesterase n=1 Tax=Sphingomonas sp. TaxID=28214 RepID=UPI001D54DB2B|nr:PaaI family thioesterase [Sphingomonas sp.]MBX9795406.1 PaaI family thioesterase [Sphingomonas sp.]
MSDAARPTLDQLRAICAASPFDAWAGFDLVAAQDGRAELRVAQRADLLQQSAFLHAGVLGALIDRAAGFAAASVAGGVITASYQTNMYRPAVGEAFVARARVVRAGKRQIFAEAEVFALSGGQETLVAGGTAILMTLG